MAFERDEVKRRVEEKVAAGDFFFPEDLARAIAKELGVDVSGTPFGQVDWTESPTKGAVSGESPKGEDHVAPVPAVEEKSAPKKGKK